MIFIGCSGTVLEQEKLFEKELVGLVKPVNWFGLKKLTLDSISKSKIDFEIYNLPRYKGINKLKVIVFASYFCDDCDKYLPSIIYLLKSLNINDENLLLIGINKYFEEPSGNYEKYKIENTPTILLTIDEKELFRILINNDNWIKEFNDLYRKYFK